MSNSVYSFAHEAMSTEFEVIIASDDQELARAAAAAVFREVDHLERLLSRYDAGSDIGQINLLKTDSSVRVTVDTFECIQVAQWVHGVTGGMFDPTIGPLMSCWRDDQGNSRTPSSEEIAAARDRVGLHKLVLDPEVFSVGWLGAPGALDLGGIGKGFAIDKAAEILDDWDITNAVISGGGSTVRTIGSSPEKGSGWPIGIGGQWAEAEGCGTISLKNRSLSGSGKEVKGEHIIHPQKGRPATTHIGAWAVAPSAAKSDGLATAFMMMGRGKVEAVCRKHSGVGAFLVLPDETTVRIGLESR
ncbi:MAG: FAD:protein FMN transferase [Kiritimatiellae bacterium]|nr:FAD:protein FMN transferase [Kiritimatiellia bacterium]